MTWLRLIQLVLVLATRIAGTVRADKLMTAGEAKATARSLAALTHALGISQQVREEVAAMSDADLDAELRGD